MDKPIDLPNQVGWWYRPTSNEWQKIEPNDPDWLVYELPCGDWQGPYDSHPEEEKIYYTIEEIKTIFWKHFHKSGERWFDYLSDEEECNRCTESIWSGFLENLKNKRI
jgi:hypothetical protein